MKCIICGSNNWSSKYRLLSECKDCGYIRAKDKYFNNSSVKLYSKKYFEGIDYHSYKKEEKILKRNFADRLKRIKEVCSNGRLLEVGCAYGYFLDLAKRDFGAEGIEINKEIAEIARENSKCKIYSGDLLKSKLSKKYDVICMFDVIEHLKKPDKYIAKSNELLKKGGIVVIETGDIGSHLARKQGAKWRLIDPPQHLAYFSKKSLTKLLENKGFEVEYFRYVPFHRTLSQVVYRLANRKLPTSFTDRLSLISFPLQTFDLMFVIAKKL